MDSHKLRVNKPQLLLSEIQPYEMGHQIEIQSVTSENAALKRKIN